MSHLPERSEASAHLMASSKLPRPPRTRQRGPQGFFLALQFLTLVPIPRRMLSSAQQHSDIVGYSPKVNASSPSAQAPFLGHEAQDAPAAAPDMSSALPWFPLVGAGIGVLLAVVDALLRSFFSLDVRDVVLLAIPALLTGMLHLDGFVDCCDGLLGYRTITRRLEILRDSRVGAYGAIGIALLLIARYAALGSLAGTLRPLALVAAPLLGRWSMVYAVTRYPYARTVGAGSGFRGRGRHLTLATIMALALLMSLALVVSRQYALPILMTLVASLALITLVVTLAWTRWASRRLGGGLTGDTYGALNELVELAVLLLAPTLALLIVHL